MPLSIFSTMQHNRDARPPRSARPRGHSSSTPAPTPPRPERQPHPTRPDPDNARGISFQTTERGDRHDATDAQRQRTFPSAYQPHLVDPETGEYLDPSKVGRKKSLVRPDREKIEPGHRLWHYRNHATQSEEQARVGVLPSTTGNFPRETANLRRGRSILGREEDVHESGLSLFKRHASIRRKRTTESTQPLEEKPRSGCLGSTPGPKNAWMIYCFVITCFIPPFFMKACGLRSPEQQRAWREKMGLISIILSLMAGVGFITFGFTKAVCGRPPDRHLPKDVGAASVIIHGKDYDFSKFQHPRAGPFNGRSNPVFEGSWGVASNDASFLFQNVNQHCLGLITKANTSTITGDGGLLDWYFPCNVFNKFGQKANQTGYDSKRQCHTSSTAKNGLASMVPQGIVYYEWEEVRHGPRNLAVYQSSVLDLDLLQWLNPAQVQYPPIFDEMKVANGTYNNKDLTMMLLRRNQENIGECLQDIVQVGFIDTKTVGCVASDVLLYVSLVFIVGVVAIRFIMAVMFQWFFSWKLGNFPRETYEERMQRSREIEAWSNQIYSAAPSRYRPTVEKGGTKLKGNKRAFLPSHSRFTPADNPLKGRPATAYGILDSSSSTNFKRPTTLYSTSAKGSKLTPPETPSQNSRSTVSFVDKGSSFSDVPCPFPLKNVVPQPSPDYEPFNFPLAHVLCLITAYSESEDGLRTTLDSIATTDYPNSHKVILIIADGMVRGENSDKTTPDICLSMMTEFVIPPEEVEPHSYVAIADGHKRHNMAKVYAGFYKYDDGSVERSKQQRVPIVLVAKCGNPLEANDAKPGNRGKRDSQIVLMSFLQKVMFDERMTTFEYEFFNSLWRVSGVSPDRYELALCVDADTKIFPDALTRMVSCMVCDQEIMGLCGETKIANKAESFITMMQVFEYYISHHMTKAFESMFGGVTCLPGCFSMYRIKARKGEMGFWVPILANPDIVEHYSENVVDTLHKKNLLLLGEDRYLTTLLLKTFPKRKNVFCPQAVCKTVVPDTFRVLLSQRRRWINSTIHNLAELVLVRDLCGTFCFSMQFVVGMELLGTLVLPAAIAFTLYLIIDSIIPGGTDTTIPLILLAIVLGLPGLLIVITSRKVAYIGWMLVYLLSLPIWNGILPAYAFWHFDDFSWGQTRKVAGGGADNHGDKDGEFDSSHIVMKRWAEFERDRRAKGGLQSRDSLFFDKRPDSNRYSTSSYEVANQSNQYESSTSESAYGPGQVRTRMDSNTLLMLPAPLATNRGAVMSNSTFGMSRSSEDYTPEGNHSHQRLIPTPQSLDQHNDSYEGTGRYQYDPYDARVAASNSRVASPQSYYPDSRNPFRGSATSTASPTSYESDPAGFLSDPEEHARRQNTRSGVRLTDSGPVPGPEGVRRVARSNNRRSSSQAPPQNRYSRGSYNLPPGAAAPSPSGGYGRH